MTKDRHWYRPILSTKGGLQQFIDNHLAPHADGIGTYTTDDDGHLTTHNFERDDRSREVTICHLYEKEWVVCFIEQTSKGIRRCLNGIVTNHLGIAQLARFARRDIDLDQIKTNPAFDWNENESCHDA